MPFTLVDDGTLDTVISCDECGEQLRYNSDGEMEYDDFIEWAIEDANDTHECELKASSS